MNGQWKGNYAGTNTGEMIVDLDDHGNHFEGYAYSYPDNKSLPETYVHIKTVNKNSPTQLKVFVFPLDPETGSAETWDKIAHKFPGVSFSKEADVTIEYNEVSLKIEWKASLGTEGIATLVKGRVSENTEYTPLADIQNWSQFRSFVSSLEYRHYIFRGQREQKRLRTSFHRTGRADLQTFLNRDVKTLYRHLSQRTKHIFNLDIPDQNGAFLNLVQHHGYPTPILDWTFSPFVGVFFAFRNISNFDASKASDSDRVRIFMFNQRGWCERYPQMKILVGKPHFSIMEFIAIENERLIPQQSISSVTNIDDIESYIRRLEDEPGQYLKIIDLPVKERPLVMRELALMGITAGSLFPGFDGACEELKERFFAL